jgi:hypothetical protein
LGGATAQGVDDSKGKKRDILPSLVYGTGEHVSRYRRRWASAFIYNYNTIYVYLLNVIKEKSFAPCPGSKIILFCNDRIP